MRDPDGRAPDAAPDARPVLQVRDLRIALPTAAGVATAVRGIDLDLRPGDTLGLIGESGCGKSLTALALMGLLPDGAHVDGSIRLEGRELAGASDRAWCELRGRRIAMIFQEPMTALDPLRTVGEQIAEPLRRHLDLPREAARARALELLERVRMPDAGRRLHAHPHELSGGQRQRVLIAMALACRPAVLVADEPTTALDAALRREMLALVDQLVREEGMALLLISHDLALMATHVQRLAVMYAGLVVDAGPTADVLARRAHPYTDGLFAARPVLGLARHTRLPTIRGRVPPIHAWPPGCPFEPRCPVRVDACTQAIPDWTAVGPDHAVRCIRPLRADPPVAPGGPAAEAAR